MSDPKTCQCIDLKTNAPCQCACDDQYFTGEDYRYFGRPIRKNSRSLANMMNINALLLYISVSLAYFAIPEFLMAINVWATYSMWRLAWIWFYIAASAVTWSVVFFMHKYRSELLKNSIGHSPENLPSHGLP